MPASRRSRWLVLPIIRMPLLSSSPSTSLRKYDRDSSLTRLSRSSNTSRQGAIRRAMAKMLRIELFMSALILMVLPQPGVPRLALLEMRYLGRVPYRVFLINSTTVKEPVHVVDKRLFHRRVQNHVVPTCVLDRGPQAMILAPTATIKDVDFFMKITTPLAAGLDQLVCRRRMSVLALLFRSQDKVKDWSCQRSSYSPNVTSSSRTPSPPCMRVLGALYSRDETKLSPERFSEHFA
ncbi:hypothetical protein KC347_g269 [Hortaea werneckii]|nr:hypothetical protein KC347_g269 [Hortaea werneckii]